MGRSPAFEDPDLELYLNRLDEWPESRGRDVRFRAAVREALATAERPPSGELSITLVGEEEMRELNRTYRHRDGPTDVLAFDLGDEGAWLGDVYICPPVARRSARERGGDPEEELLRLVVHGVLHLLGHDHPHGAESGTSAMIRLQERILERLGTGPRWVDGAGGAGDEGCDASS